MIIYLIYMKKRFCNSISEPFEYQLIIIPVFNNMLTLKISDIEAFSYFSEKKMIPLSFVTLFLSVLIILF